MPTAPRRVEILTPSRPVVATTCGELSPRRWLLVVVSYEKKPARIISVFGNRKDPRSWSK